MCIWQDLLRVLSGKTGELRSTTIVNLLIKIHWAWVALSTEFKFFTFGGSEKEVSNWLKNFYCTLFDY